MSDELPPTKSIMLSLPRSGSSWLGEALAQANNLQLGFEQLSPEWRKNAQLDLAFGGCGPGNHNICRPGRYIYDVNNRVARAVEGLPPFDKEVWCHYRVPELRQYAELFVLYRPIHMTLPFRAQEPYGWYKTLWSSFIANQGLYRPSFAAVIEELRRGIEGDHQIASVAHFLASQVLLRSAELYSVPVLSYETVIRASQEELVPLLEQWLPSNLLAAPSAAKICETRKFSPRPGDVSFLIHDQLASMLERAGIYVASAPQYGEVLHPRRG